MTDNTVCNLGNIKGEKGDKGDKGDKGADGKNGKDGRGIAKTELVNGELIITYTDGTSDNLGSIGGDVTDSTSMLKFNILDDGTLSVAIKSDYQNSAEKIIIPSTYNGRKVTTVADNGFYKCPNLKSVVIPNSVNTLGDKCFSNCQSLTDVTMTSSVTKIGTAAFSYCNSLTDFTIPENLTSISNEMFFKSTSLSEIHIPDSVKKIGNSAFNGCSALTELTIPKNVTYIGDIIIGGTNCSKVVFEDANGWSRYDFVSSSKNLYRHLLWKMQKPHVKC